MKPVLNRFVEEHPHRAYSLAQIQALAAHWHCVLIQNKPHNHPLHDAYVAYIDEWRQKKAAVPIKRRYRKLVRANKILKRKIFNAPDHTNNHTNYPLVTPKIAVEDRCKTRQHSLHNTQSDSLLIIKVTSSTNFSLVKGNSSRYITRNYTKVINDSWKILAASSLRPNSRGKWIITPKGEHSTQNSTTPSTMLVQPIRLHC